ncbi:hypothetical protein PAHAL_9G028600 [Panicum hallii]|jgi:hypothetical protein|uniref:Uncharacterized protein n=1 Tax=Panicum hallii TaxID=206008 RepID=A0A2T8HZZ8_9POAL|nr:hypothetical protein PAHAL_9G028600 [Panicum hallii]
MRARRRGERWREGPSPSRRSADVAVHILFVFPHLLVAAWSSLRIFCAETVTRCPYKQRGRLCPGGAEDPAGVWRCTTADGGRQGGQLGMGP